MEENSRQKTPASFLAWLGQHFPEPLDSSVDRFERVDAINSLLGVLYVYDADSRTMIRTFQSRALRAQSTSGIVEFCRFLSVEAIADNGENLKRAKESKDWLKAKTCVYLEKEFLPELKRFIDMYAQEHTWLPLESIPDITAHHFNLQSPFATVASMKALVKAHATFAANNFRIVVKKQRTE